MTPARLAELRAVADAATKGPWVAVIADGACLGIDAEADPDGIVETDAGHYPPKPADAVFIAAARAAVPDLLDEIERMRAVVEAAERVRDARDIDGSLEPIVDLDRAVDAYRTGKEPSNG